MQTLCVIHHAQTTKNTRFVLQILEAMTDPECLHEAVDCKVVLLEAQVGSAKIVEALTLCLCIILLSMYSERLRETFDCSLELFEATAGGSKAAQAKAVLRMIVKFLRDRACSLKVLDGLSVLPNLITVELERTVSNYAQESWV